MAKVLLDDLEVGGGGDTYRGKSNLTPTFQTLNNPEGKMNMNRNKFIKDVLRNT